MDDLSDEYIARLLAEDARKTSSRYAKQSSSVPSSRPRPANALKPNTRFLQNIVREADQHNSALRRREEIDAQARLRNLRRNLSSTSGQESAVSRLSRRTHLSDRRSNSSRDDRSHSDKRRRHRRHGQEISPRAVSSDAVNGDCRRPDEQTSDSRRASNYPRSRNPQVAADACLARHASHLDSTETTEQEGVHPHDGENRVSTSTIDQHFAASYNPAQDVRTYSQDRSFDDDWDMALEAVRDREKWKRSQAASMKAAGYKDQDIEQWRHGFTSSDGRERDPGELKWAKKGEVREWDHNKLEQ